MRDYSTRSTEEATTHRLFDEALARNWSQGRAVVSLVFRAMWSSALTVDNIATIGQAMAFLTDKPDLSRTLTDLAREKVLRSYMSRGVRHYEVNF